MILACLVAVCFIRSARSGCAMLEPEFPNGALVHKTDPDIRSQFGSSLNPSLVP